MTYSSSTPRLTITTYTVSPDGTRTHRAFTSSDEPVRPPVSSLAWPACACPRHRPHPAAHSGSDAA